MNMEDTALAPSLANVKAACEEFDHEEAIIEGALAELFTAYPANTTAHHVLLKTTAVNALYSTQIPLYSRTKTSLRDVADNICRNGPAIDAALAEGNPDVVGQISRPDVAPKKAIGHFSFATKYCSWHRPECYPIWDSRVRAYLLWLQKEHGFAKDFKVDGSWKYPAFKEVIGRFRKQYELDAFSFKQIDKFLYRAGDVLMKQQQKKGTNK
jgi:hypothetical protein